MAVSRLAAVLAGRNQVERELVHTRRASFSRGLTVLPPARIVVVGRAGRLPSAERTEST
jgi:hypothetical protein